MERRAQAAGTLASFGLSAARPAWSQWPESRHHISRCSVLTFLPYGQTCGLLRCHRLASSGVSLTTLQKHSSLEPRLEEDGIQPCGGHSGSVSTHVTVPFNEVLMGVGGNRDVQGVKRRHGKVSHQQACINIFLRAAKEHALGLQSGITVLFPLN